MAGETTNVGFVGVRVKVDNHTDDQFKMIQLNIKNALRAMADATLARAQMLAPQSNIPGHAGTLRANGRIESEDDGMVEKVVFGGTDDVPYARYQEFGSENWNYTTSGTGPHYLQQGGDSVKQEGINKYL